MFELDVVLLVKVKKSMTGGREVSLHAEMPLNTRTRQAASHEPKHTRGRRKKKDPHCEMKLFKMASHMIRLHYNYSSKFCDVGFQNTEGKMSGIIY